MKRGYDGRKDKISPQREEGKIMFNSHWGTNYRRGVDGYRLVWESSTGKAGTYWNVCLGKKQLIL